jgi:hypothetical protein
MRCARRHNAGLTVLELMVVLAIIVMLLYGLGRGLRALTKGDLVDDAVELASTLRKTSLLAVETGQIHRVVFDFEHDAYMIEACQGAGTVTRGGDEERVADPRKVADQLEAGRQRLATMGQQATGGASAINPPNADDAARAAAAIAGHHVLDRVCSPAVEDPSPDKRTKEQREAKVRKLNPRSEVKLKEIWVQHLDESVTSGIAMIYFFPYGSAEKAIVELVSGGTSFSVLVYGLSGRIELIDGPPPSADDHMLRDIEGNKEEER